MKTQTHTMQVKLMRYEYGQQRPCQLLDCHCTLIMQDVSIKRSCLKAFVQGFQGYHNKLHSHQVMQITAVGSHSLELTNSSGHEESLLKASLLDHHSASVLITAALCLPLCPSCPFFILIYLFVVLCVNVSKGMLVPWHTYVATKGQPLRVGVLLPPVGSETELRSFCGSSFNC